MSERLEQNARYNEFFITKRVPFQSWFIIKAKKEPSADLELSGQYRFDKVSHPKEGAAVILALHNLERQLKTKLTLGLDTTKIRFLFQPSRFNIEGESKLKVKKWTTLNLAPLSYTYQTEVAFSKKIFGRYFTDSEIVHKFTKVPEGKDKCSTQMSQQISWDTKSIGLHATLDWN
jgi:hypothetical protein